MIERRERTASPEVQGALAQLLNAELDELFSPPEFEGVRQRIAELVAQELSDSEIGRRVGYSGVIVGRHRRALGLEHAGPSRTRRDPHERESHVRRATALRAAGASGAEIAETLGISAATVGRDLGGLGLDVHRRRSKVRALARADARRMEADRLKERHGDLLEDHEVDKLHGLKPGTFQASYAGRYVKAAFRVGSGRRSLCLYRRADVDPLPWRGTVAESSAAALAADWHVVGPTSSAALDRKRNGQHVVSGSVRKAWKGAGTLRKVRNPGRKGLDEALEMAPDAIQRVQRHGGAERVTPDLRRAIIEALMRKHYKPSKAAALDLENDGGTVLERADGSRRPRTDPIYRRGRAQVMERIDRACRDSASSFRNAPELRALLG